MLSNPDQFDEEQSEWVVSESNQKFAAVLSLKGCFGLFIKRGSRLPNANLYISTYMPK